MSWRPVLLAVGSLTLTACVGMPGRVNFDPASISNANARDVLLATDLVHARSQTVYEAILEVRPDFFDRRVPGRMHGKPQSVRVFVDDVEMGDLDALRTIPLGPVTSVRYVGPGDAEFHRGHGTRGAMILVTTAR